MTGKQCYVTGLNWNYCIVVSSCTCVYINNVLHVRCLVSDSVLSARSINTKIERKKMRTGTTHAQSLNMLATHTD